MGRLEQPTIMDGTARSRVRHVEFARSPSRDAMRMRPRSAGRPAGGGRRRAADLRAGERADRTGDHRRLDLFKTDFPLRVAFPLILSNTLCAGCTRRRSISRACSWPPASRFLLPVPHGITPATVTRERSGGEGAREARGGELHENRRGPSTPWRRRRRSARGRQPHGRRRVELEPRPLRRDRSVGEATARGTDLSASCGRCSCLLAVVLLAWQGLLYWRRQSGGRAVRPASAAIGGRWPCAARWWWCWR